MFTFSLTTAAINFLDSNPGESLLISKSKLGSSYGYVPTLDDTDLHGSLLYQMRPSEPRRVNATTVFYTLVLDISVGPFNFGELGFYLADGTLIALGSSTHLYPKVGTNQVATGNSIRIDFYITSVDGNHTAYGSISSDSDNSKVSTVATVDSLPAAPSAESNIYVMAHPKDETQSVSATSLNSLWTVDGYNKVAAKGQVVTIGGMGFNVAYDDAEVPNLGYPGALLIQLTTGPAAGCIRVVTNVGSNHLEFGTPMMALPNVGDYFVVYGANGDANPEVEIGTQLPGAEGIALPAMLVVDEFNTMQWVPVEGPEPPEPPVANYLRVYVDTSLNDEGDLVQVNYFEGGESTYEWRVVGDPTFSSKSLGDFITTSDVSGSGVVELEIKTIPTQKVSVSGNAFTEVTSFGTLNSFTGLSFINAMTGSSSPNLAAVADDFPVTVTDVTGMFAYTSFNSSLSGWNVSNVKNMSYMFAMNMAFNQPIGN